MQGYFYRRGMNLLNAEEMEGLNCAAQIFFSSAHTDKILSDIFFSLM